MELFDDRVVLFESDEGGEYLLVTCEPSGMGGLVVRQTSEGPLTQWCFEESPHVVETFVTHVGLVALEHFYGVGTSNQVARMLSISFADYDCAQRVRSLLRELDAKFDVIEKPIDRTGNGGICGAALQNCVSQKSLRLSLTPIS